MPKRRFRHPKHGDRYTPVTPQMIELFEEMKRVHGSYRIVCWKANMNMKVFRRYRKGTKTIISLRKLDSLITGTGVGSLDNYPWFTPEDLIALGLWKDVQYVVGRKRIRL